jgi:hypothetical protein
MRPVVALAPLFVLLAGLGTFTAAYTRPAPVPPAAAADGRPRVKLAVLVMFDQMRGDYLARWRPLLGPDGFARLQSEGAWFTRCLYPYGTTTTGPGHASVLTGTCPDKHGIVNNNWFERGADVYCAADPRYQLYPRPPVATDPKTGRPQRPPAGGTPERLLSETVGDVLKQAHGPRARVFGLSLKDRSAILTTGQRPDGAFWFDGRVVTSDYYLERLDRRYPRWAETYNHPSLADHWFGAGPDKDWVRFRPALDYAALSGPDDAPGEGSGQKQGRTFPHPMTGGLAKPGKAFYDAVATSPYGNAMLLQVAKTCLRLEGLGADDVPDLLVVSFSSNDLIGHTWGPDSQEVLDVTLRADALMADFLRFLDDRVGKGNYVLAVTADHGVCPLVEASVRKGREAKRVDLIELQKAAEGYLRERFAAGTTPDPKAKSGWIERFMFPWVYLNPRMVAASGRPREVVADALKRYLATVPDVERAFTRADLAGDFPESDVTGRRVKRACFVPRSPNQPERCGDVYVVLNKYDLPMKPGSTGTTHGSPYDYDAHVPLLVYGPGIPGGVRTEPVTPQATAAIFARYLGVRPPADADFPVPMTLEKKD